MRRRALWLPLCNGWLLGVGCAPCLAAGQVPSTIGDPHLALGIRQVEDGDLETAVFTLDGVVRRLGPFPGKRGELVTAYLYLGTAFLGLEHERAARGKFREALRLDPELRLTPGAFPPRVIDLFESEALKAAAAKQKRGATKFLILGGLGAATAVGASVASRGTAAPANRPPTGLISVSPEGLAILGVTVMRFTGSGTDPDGEPVSYRWDFGDGTAASGPTASHVFATEATFTVRLTVSDGRGGESTTAAAVVVRSLSGQWYYRNSTTGLRNDFSCVQLGTNLQCQLVSSYSDAGPIEVGVVVADPHRVVGGFYRLKGSSTLFAVTHGWMETNLNSIQLLTAENYGFSILRA